MARKPITADDSQPRPMVGSPKPFPHMSAETTVEVKMAPAFARILEHVFRVDPWADYSRLEAELKIGERGYTDRDTLMKARNEAEDNARKAHQLYCAARVEQERYELDAKTIEAAARGPILRELEEEKVSGQRKKQITESDIEQYMLIRFADEYKELHLTRLKLRKMVEHMEKLAEFWVKRCNGLDTMLGRSR